ncbi:mucin-17-like [Octopus bimaculoides]|uniref:mucin-17-like n=1 Tax=Octopus bimaculoides TaxID=37653 RepID=UPI0022E06713|nr:mucin-17-like [Octopus bimaculoides]
MHGIRWFVFIYVLVIGQFGLILVREIHTVSPCVLNRNRCFPYQWQSNISTHVDKDHHSLKVRFSHAPPETKFVYYEVKLIGGIRNIKKTAEKEVVFNNICNGKYTISVKPFDPHPSVKDTCLCYKIEGRCHLCKATIKQIAINKTDDSKCNETTTWKPHLQNLTTAKRISTLVRSTPVISTPVSSTSVISTPVISTPVSSTPVSSTPVSSTPVSSTPAISTPAISTPAISTPAISTPISLTPVISTLVSSTSVNYSSSANNSIFQTSSTTTRDETKNKNEIILWAVIGSLAAIITAFSFICFIHLAKRSIK